MIIYQENDYNSSHITLVSSDCNLISLWLSLSRRWVSRMSANDIASRSRHVLLLHQRHDNIRIRRKSFLNIFVERDRLEVFTHSQTIWWCRRVTSPSCGGSLRYIKPCSVSRSVLDLDWNVDVFILISCCVLLRLLRCSEYFVRYFILLSALKSSHLPH